MSRTPQIAVALTVLVSLVPARAANAWSQLRPGMSRAETSEVLGSPLLMNRGHGFELWLYDGGAEVVCYRNVLVAWTAPAILPTAPTNAAATPAAAIADPRHSKSTAHAVTREQIRRVYDKFPAFRTEIDF